MPGVNPNTVLQLSAGAGRGQPQLAPQSAVDNTVLVAQAAIAAHTAEAHTRATEAAAAGEIRALYAEGNAAIAATNSAASQAVTYAQAGREIETVRAQAGVAVTQAMAGREVDHARAQAGGSGDGGPSRTAGRCSPRPVWTDGERSGGGSEDSPVRGQAREGVGWITSPARAGETYSEADRTGTSTSTSTITCTDTGTSSRNRRGGSGFTASADTPRGGEESVAGSVAESKDGKRWSPPDRRSGFRSSAGRNHQGTADGRSGVNRRGRLVGRKRRALIVSARPPAGTLPRAGGGKSRSPRPSPSARSTRQIARARNSDGKVTLHRQPGRSGTTHQGHTEAPRNEESALTSMLEGLEYCRCETWVDRE